VAHSEVQDWFHRRLFDSTISFPFKQIYEWLYYWFGFDENNQWASRERMSCFFLFFLFLNCLFSRVHEGRLAYPVLEALDD
jgi:hypothetical protein